MNYLALGDIHLRDKAPVNRVDDFMATQERKLRWVLAQATKHCATILVAGDLFHVAKPSPFLLAWTIRILSEFEGRIIVTPGNHDLPFHRIQNVEQSGLQVLAEAGVIEIAFGGWFDEDVESDTITSTRIFASEWDADLPEQDFDKQYSKHIMLMHRMVVEEELFPGQVADKAMGILRRLRLFDFIAVGDNHTTIISKAGKRILFNSGSMMRNNVDQIDHKPCVGLWRSEPDADEEAFEVLYIPIAPEVLNLEKGEQEKAANEALDSFIAELQSDCPHISFEANMASTLAANPVDKDVRDLINEAMGE